MSKYQENLSPSDLFLELEAFSEGRSTHAWKCFGAHPAKAENGTEGYLFRVWAPNARSVSVVGEFNDWTPGFNPLKQKGGCAVPVRLVEAQVQQPKRFAFIIA